MEENYLALLLAILKELEVDDCLREMGFLKKKLGTGKRKWNEFREEELIVLYEKGISQKNLATIFNTSPNAINCRLCKLRKCKLIC